MKEFRPAVVYAPQASPRSLATLDQFMLEQGLYYADVMVERPEDRALPVTARPQLLRYLPWFASGFVAAFIVDHLSDLADTAAEQLGYLGFVLSQGVPVHVNGAWYDRQANRSARERLNPADRARVNRVQQMLADDARPEHAAALQVVAQEWPVDVFRLPTSNPWGPYWWYEDACWRAKILHEDYGKSQAEIEIQLSLEGYRNKSGRACWYRAAVKQALDDADTLLANHRRTRIEPCRSLIERVR